MTTEANVKTKSAARWITVEAERALFVDRGRGIVVCDRLPSPVTLIVQLKAGQ